MAYSGEKSSITYSRFFDEKSDKSLPIETVAILERDLSMKEGHLWSLNHQNPSKNNAAMGQAIREARNAIRDVVGLMPLPPLETKKADVAEEQPVVSPKV